MKLTNDSYVILIGTKNFTERYRRDKKGWFKVSSRGRTFRMTAEQLLNHLLPAAAGIKPSIIFKVKYRPKAEAGSKPAYAKAPAGRRRLVRRSFNEGGTPNEGGEKSFQKATKVRKSKTG